MERFCDLCPYLDLLIVSQQNTERGLIRVFSPDLYLNPVPHAIFHRNCSFLPESLFLYLLILKVFIPVCHKFPHILPLIGLVGRPPAAQKRRYEQLLPLFHCTNITVSSLSRESGLSTDRTFHGCQESIMIDAGETPYPGKVGKGVGRCSCDGKELFFCRGEHDAVSEDPRQVCRSGGMNLPTLLILRIQPVGRQKICIITAKFRCLPVHHVREIFHAAPDRFRDGHCGVIVGFQHQGVKKVFQSVFLPFSHMQLHLRHGRRPV